MSNRALRWAFSLPIKGAAKAVLLALADSHNETTGRCDPGVPRIALHAGVDERTVRRALHELETVKLMPITQRAGTSSQYELAIGKGVDTPDTTPAPPLTLRHPRKRQTPDTVPSHPGRDASPIPDTVSGTPDTTPPKPLEPLEPKENPKSGTAHSTDTLFAEQPRRRRQKAAPKRTTISPDWQPSLAGIAYTKARGLDVHAVARKFHRNYLASGMKQADWDLKFEGWCDNERSPDRRPTGNSARQAAGKLDWLTSPIPDDSNTIDGELA